MGKIIADEWLKTEQIRPNVELDEWQVMPNHIHGIIILNNKSVETPRRGVSINTNNAINSNNTIDANDIIDENDTISVNETTEPVVCTTGAGNKKARLYSNSIGAIIGQFKSVCTKCIWKSGHPEFNWQTRFHDRIIRDEQELYRIREYIRNNLGKWEDDRYHPDAHQEKP